MSGGTGDSGFATGMNLFTNAATMGLFGYDENGFKAGYSGAPLVKGTKEITGAKAAEDANAAARDQFDADVAAKEKDRANAVQQNMNNQLQMSNNAGAARSAGTQTKTSGKVIGDVSDFLGL